MDTMGPNIAMYETSIINVFAWKVDRLGHRPRPSGICQ